MEPNLKMDDAELLGMIRKSPANWNPVWMHLWTTHREVAKAVISRWEKDELEQDEIFDNSLIIFRRKVLDQSFLGQSTIRTFIIGICKTICWQRNSRQKPQIRPAPDELQDFIYHLKEDGTSLLEDIYNQEENRILNRVIQQVDEECQQFLLEYYWEQLSQKEMAVSRKMKGASSIKNKLLKCRKKLRVLLVKDSQAREVLVSKMVIQEEIRQKQATIKKRSK